MSRPDTTARDAAAPPGSAATGSPAPTAATELAALTSRADGTAYLAGWTVARLRALAADLGLRGVGRLRRADLVDRIVDRAIGFRLDSTAIRRR